MIIRQASDNFPSFHVINPYTTYIVIVMAGKEMLVYLIIAKSMLFVDFDKKKITSDKTNEY